jgi:hypothetical protein
LKELNGIGLRHNEIASKGRYRPQAEGAFILRLYLVSVLQSSIRYPFCLDACNVDIIEKKRLPIISGSLALFPSLAQEKQC